MTGTRREYADGPDTRLHCLALAEAGRLSGSHRQETGGRPLSSVLAAVDFSPVTASVVSHALSLADGAQVEALHVLGSEVEQRLRKAKFVQVDITDWLTRLRAEAEKQLDGLLASVGNASAVVRRIQPALPPR